MTARRRASSPVTSKNNNGPSSLVCLHDTAELQITDLTETRNSRAASGQGEPEGEGSWEKEPQPAGF